MKVCKVNIVKFSNQSSTDFDPIAIDRKRDGIAFSDKVSIGCFDARVANRSGGFG